jgi:hypothetical protein
MTARHILAPVLAALAVALAGCASPVAASATPTPTHASAPASTQAVPPSPTSSRAAAPAPPQAATAAPPQAIRQQVEVTFYAAADNDPPGSAEIAYPNSRHASAGGTGTVDDPLSLATDPREIRPGVLVYYPPVRKYFVMEDDCAECIDEWSRDRTPHVDLWTSGTTDPAVQDCEAALTPDSPDTIIINPPTDLSVDTRPLYAGGRCWPNT